MLKFSFDVITSERQMALLKIDDRVGYPRNIVDLVTLGFYFLINTTINQGGRYSKPLYIYFNGQPSIYLSQLVLESGFHCSTVCVFRLPSENKSISTDYFRHWTLLIVITLITHNRQQQSLIFFGPDQTIKKNPFLLIEFFLFLLNLHFISH